MNSTIKPLEIQKNNPSQNWREVRSDSKSQPRYDYSFFDLSLLQELQFVKPDNQDPMDYGVYDSKFNQIVGGWVIVSIRTLLLVVLNDANTVI